MIKLTLVRSSSIQLLSRAYRITTLLLCVTCLYAGPGNANDLKDILVEALKDKHMNHAEMKHDNNTHGNGKLGSNMDHSNMKSGGPGHKPVDASTWPSKPSLTLTAYKDAMAGWNLHIEPTNFDFAPERVNTANEVGKGHAHLYINGKKTTRLYSNWYYLNNLQPGTHSITVALNANDHGPLVLEEQHISATVELIQE
ncbi:MAG: hypothetical protein KTR35_17750 [Gammaproteobacteria bacterium]|nr:hypothetical protein [Gammaproteobacteria bacterium]